MLPQSAINNIPILQFLGDCTKALQDFAILFVFRDLGNRASPVNRAHMKRPSDYTVSFFHLKVTIPCPKFLFSSPTSLRMAKCFDLVGDFASIDQCCSIFTWLVPLVSELLVWLNGKHPCVIDL